MYIIFFSTLLINFLILIVIFTRLSNRRDSTEQSLENKINFLIRKHPSVTTANFLANGSLELIGKLSHDMMLLHKTISRLEDMVEKMKGDTK